MIQLGDLRITSAWPPFSDAREITVVRPVAKLKRAITTSISDWWIDCATIILVACLSVGARVRVNHPRPSHCRVP